MDMEVKPLLLTYEPLEALKRQIALQRKFDAITEGRTFEQMILQMVISQFGMSYEEMSRDHNAS